MIFVVEVIIKLIGFGKKFFSDNWNTLDFIVVIVSLVSIILEFSTKLTALSSASALRLVRISKLLLVLKKQRSL